MPFQPFPWRDWETGHRINAQRLNGPAREIVAGTELYIEQGFEVRATGNPWEVEITPGRAYWKGYLLEMSDPATVVITGAAGDYWICLDASESADPQGGFYGVEFTFTYWGVAEPPLPPLARVTADGSGNITRICHCWYPRAGFQHDTRLLFSQELLLCKQTDVLDNAFRSPIFTAGGDAVLEDYRARLPIIGFTSSLVSHFFRKASSDAWVYSRLDMRITLAGRYTANPARDQIRVVVGGRVGLADNLIGFRLVPYEDGGVHYWEVYAYRETNGAAETNALITIFPIGDSEPETHLRLILENVGGDEGRALYIPVRRLGTKALFYKEDLPSGWVPSQSRLQAVAEGTDDHANYEVCVVGGLIITD